LGWFKQAVLDGKETEVCLVRLDVMVHLVEREAVVVMAAQVHKVRLVSSAAAGLLLCATARI